MGQGSSGARGYDGEMGPMGFDGTSIMGEKGEKGEKGDKGDKGDKGNAGDMGSRGFDGTSTIGGDGMGPRGFDGSEGKQGIPGADATLPPRLIMCNANGSCTYRNPTTGELFIDDSGGDGHSLFNPVDVHSKDNNLILNNGWSINTSSNGKLVINKKDGDGESISVMELNKEGVLDTKKIKSSEFNVYDDAGISKGHWNNTGITTGTSVDKSNYNVKKSPKWYMDQGKREFHEYKTTIAVDLSYDTSHSGCYLKTVTSNGYVTGNSSLGKPVPVFQFGYLDNNLMYVRRSKDENTWGAWIKQSMTFLLP
jgi:hypothetical protein